MIALLICFAIFAIGIGICCGSGSNEDAISIGVLIIIVDLIFGFGAICGTCPTGKKITSLYKPTAITKTAKRIYVELDDVNKSSDVVEIYNADTNHVMMEVTERFNAYGHKAGLVNLYKIVLVK